MESQKYEVFRVLSSYLSPIMELSILVALLSAYLAHS